MQVGHSDPVAPFECCGKLDTAMWLVAEDTLEREPHAVPKDNVDLTGVAERMIQSEQTYKNIAELRTEGQCIAG